MGLFSRKNKKEQVKDWTLVTGYPTWFAGGMSDAGQPVSPETAMQLSAVYGCVRIISEAIAELPLHLFRYLDTGSKVKAIDNPLYTLMHDEPNHEMTSFVYRETIMAHLCLWGNSYSQIIRNGRGEILEIYPLLPSQMQVVRDPKSGDLLYYYTRTNADAEPGQTKTFILRADEVLHIPGLGYDGIKGYSPLALARNAIGSALASDKYAGRFFNNAATPSGVLEFPHSLKDPKAFRDRWEGSFAGAVNAGKTPVLEEGMTYKPISISPQDAQFLETRKFNIDEIARIFRVPPHMLAELEKSSFSNIEQQSLEFVKYTLAPWVARVEQSLKKSLLTKEEKRRYFFAFNLEGLMRGDYQSRMQGYAIGIQNGFMSPNDVRELENMNKIPEENGGDQYLVNGNMVPLSMAGAAYRND
ncbi:MAG: phage portal protein [Oscillospiraceae bacterium]|nr:phage portal protein [Oscillospiraceae bacterium]